MKLQDNEHDSIHSFITLNQISHSYAEGSQQHRVLEKVSLQISKSEKVALLGRSGSGKSTLLNLISGIDLPEQGTVTLNGLNISALNETRRTLFRRQHIGFIYQFFNLVPSLTAVENVALTLELNGMASAAAREKSMAVIVQTESGGQGRQFSFPLIRWRTTAHCHCQSPGAFPGYCSG